MSHAAKQYDSSMLSYYDEELVAQADVAYRFAFALTLSLDGAQQCVQAAFKNLASNLDNTRTAGHGEDTLAQAKSPGNDPASIVIKSCWEAFKRLQSQRFAVGQSSVTRALISLSVEARAALIAVDVVGLSPRDSALALGWSEKDLRLHLAAARRSLMKTHLDL